MHVTYSLLRLPTLLPSHPLAYLRTELSSAFRDSSSCDLRGDDLPAFLTLVDKVSDEEYQDHLQDRRSKLAQLQLSGAYSGGGLVVLGEGGAGRGWRLWARSLGRLPSCSLAMALQLLGILAT